MEERFRFVETFKRGECSLAEACRQFSVSRKTGYKWLARYEKGGLDALRDQPRAPHAHPNQVLTEVEQLVLETRAEHPTWGPLKIRAKLAREMPEVHWPAASTIAEILQRRGLTVPRKKRPRATPSRGPLAHADACNAVWCVDFKGWFQTQDGSRCDPLTLSDAFSRFLLRCQALAKPNDEHVWPLCEATFREYGLPEAIRSDNGPPFAGVGLGGLSPLAVRWIKLGIRPERIQPGKPQQNGRHERMHRTLKEATAKPPAESLRAQQRRFDRFRQEYNHDRPHEALQQHTPAEFYTPSPRRYPKKLSAVEYPSDWQVRLVNNGEIRWGKKLFISKALHREYIGLEPVDDRHWRLWFSFYELGVLDQATGRISPPPPPTAETEA